MAAAWRAAAGRFELLLDLFVDGLTRRQHPMAVGHEVKAGCGHAPPARRARSLLRFDTAVPAHEL